MGHYIHVGNVKGPKGDKGDPGNTGAQGLPGTGAVPADAAVAGYISTGGASDTKTALDAKYLAGAIADGYDIIPVLGQSNASGSNADYNTATTDPGDPRIFAFPAIGAGANTIVAALDPLQPPVGVGVGISMAMPFARLWTARTGRKVLIVLVAVGGTGFAYNGSENARWKVGEVVVGRTNLYELAITQITAALAAAGKNSRVPAILWHQGEADGNLPATTVDYAANLDELIVGLRTRIPEVKYSPFIVGGLADARQAAQLGSRNVQAALVATPSRVPLTGFAPSLGLADGGDGTHFTGASQRVFGRRYMDAYDRALGNRVGVAPGLVRSLRASTDRIEWVPPLDSRVVDYEVNLTGTDVSELTEVLPGSATSYQIPGDGKVALKVRARAESAVGDWLGIERYLPTLPPVLDGLDNIAYAYSTRRLRTAYAGYLIKLRRTSDNAERDFNESGADFLAVLDSWAGAGGATVRTWYDQSGNARHLHQADTALQPDVRTAGVTQLVGGRPSVYFTGGVGVRRLLEAASAPLFAAGSASIALVTGKHAGDLNQFGGERDGASNAQYNWGLQATSRTLTQSIRNNASTFVLPLGTVNEDPDAFITGLPSQMTIRDTGTAWKKRVRSVDLADIAYARTGAYTLSVTRLGAQSSGASGWTGAISELIATGDVLTTAEILRVEDSQRAYHGVSLLS